MGEQKLFSAYQLADKIHEVVPVMMRLFLRRQAGSLLHEEISFPQIILMGQLLDSQFLRMREVAQILSVTTAAASGIVERMVKKGYLKRFFDLRDRRIVKVGLTSRGKTIIETLKKKRREAIAKVLNQLNEKERRDYWFILDKIKTISQGAK